MKDLFADELRPREINLEVILKNELLEQHMISLDEKRFSILVYNLLRNSVSNTNGGFIRVTIKLLDELRMQSKLDKIAKK